MRCPTAIASLTFLMAAAFASCQNSALPNPQRDPSPVTGVWRGKIDGLPGIAMVLTDEGGSLTGAVVFYFHTRATANAPYTVHDGLPEPIFHVHRAGNRLDFDISHRRAHPPGSLQDPPSHFRFIVTGPDKAEFVNVTEDSKMSFPLERSDY
jgi:hypothetical protein